jgi:hypothetical protein
MRRAWLCTASCLLSLLLGSRERDAFAAPICDADDFCISVPAPAVTCLQFPPQRFDPASCPDLKPIASAPSSPQTRMVAIGRIFFDDGGSRAAAFMSASFAERKPSFALRETDVNDFANNQLQGFVASIGADRSGARVRSAALVTIAGVPFVRTSLDVTGLPESNALDEHVVIFAARSYAGLYQVMLGTSFGHAKALEVLLDGAAESLRIARPAPAAPGARWLTGSAIDSDRWCSGLSWAPAW